MADLDWTRSVAAACRRHGHGALVDLLAACGHGVLFQRIGGEFRLLLRAGYAGHDFSYSFLEQSPELLVTAFRKGLSRLDDASGYDSSLSLWALAEPIGDPAYLLVCELPDSFGEADVELLRFPLLTQGSPLPAKAKSGAALPVWMRTPMQQLLGLSSPALLQGESGPDCEFLIEKFVCQKFGAEQSRLFSPGRLSEPVQLREVFGDPVGARLAGGGSVVPLVERPEPVLIVDELGRLSTQVQLRLMARLSEGDPGHFWIFQSSLDLDAMAREGTVVPALYTLLQKNLVQAPPLRTSLADLASECSRLVSEFQDRYGRQTELSAAALESIAAYDWPGNWRELTRTLLAAFLMARGETIEPEDLQLGHWLPVGVSDRLNLRAQATGLEKELLLEAYALHGGNQVHMAESLGISRGALQNKLGKYSMERKA